MKLLNDIVCTTWIRFNTIEFESYWIQNQISIEIRWIELDSSNLIELNSNSNEEKWDVKWCRRHWKSIGDYGVGKKTFENTFSILINLGIG
jgi:hypothetical protein